MNTEAFFKVSYGLYLISAAHEGKKNGYVGNTVFQVTAEPPQLAISCSKNNFSCELIRSAGFFSISVLDQNTSAQLIGTFGYKSGADIDKFEGVEHIISENGTPIVTEQSLAWFECKVVKEMDVGSHILLIGEIIENNLLNSDGLPLTYAYYREVKKGMAPANAPTYIDKGKKPQEAPKEPQEHLKYRCVACGYIYDPEMGDEDSGIAPGTPFEAIPDDWLCPVCGSTKELFEPIDY
jgi:flavin reductase (DIM6/NTAB) family NADH-FMN oxidoreductase RutF/rubredoxin